MSDRTVKLVGKHIKTCCGKRHERDGSWSSCWGPLAFGDYGDPLKRTERRYGKNGRVFKTWLRYVCNDSDCKAELHVDCDWILTISALIQQARESRVP